MPHLTRAERERLDTFRRGCAAALEALKGPPITDAEHNELADRLGRPDLRRELQGELAIEPGNADA